MTTSKLSILHIFLDITVHNYIILVINRLSEGVMFIKTLLGFRNMKQIDTEISKINIALDISNSNIDSIASNTISKPSLSDVHFPKEYNDSTFVKFVEDVQKIRNKQSYLQKRLNSVLAIKNAINNSISKTPESDASKIIYSYFVNCEKVSKIASDMSMSSALVYKFISSFFDSINDLAKAH